MFEFFDKILFLNQAKRTDRLLDCQNELKRVGLNADPFYSIDAEQPYKSFCLSQIAMLKEFLLTDSKTFLALEDDVLFKDLTHLPDALNELPENWDIVYLGANVTEDKPKYHSPYLRRVRSAWTTHAVGYSRKAVEKIVENYHSWEANGMYDDWLSREFLPNNNCFIVAPMVAWQRPVFSDLWGQNVEYGWSQIEKKLV
jgi:hypothetical protein